MQTHTLDKKTSLEVFAECERDILPKECYKNVFRVIYSYLDNFKSGKWKVAYGYFPIRNFENLYARHCFIVDEDGKAIDPTAMLFPDVDRRDYYSFGILNFEEYIDAVEDEKGYVALGRYFRKEESEAQQFAFKNGIFLIG